MASTLLMRRVMIGLTGTILLSAFALAGQAEVWQPLESARVRTLASAGDFNRDGTPDQVRADGAVVSVRLSRDRHGAVQLTHRAPVVGLFVVDVDHDGDADVLTLTMAGRLRIWRNQGRGTFSAEILAPQTGITWYLPDVIAQVPTVERAQPGEGSSYTYRGAVLAGTRLLMPPIRAAPRLSRSAALSKVVRRSCSASPRAPPSRTTV